MSNHIDFYFDFISPYAFIAYKKITKIENIKFNYKPILLGGLHNLVEITAPAFNKFKLKNITNEAFKKDIFGAPTFVVNNKIFWGQDRLEYALEELNNN